MKFWCFFLTAAVAAISGTLQAAHIGFLMPAGGHQGSTVDVIIGGQAFWGVREAWISGQGVTIESVQFVRNLPLPDGRQRRWINQVLRNYHQKKPNNIPKPEDQEGWRKHDFYDRLYDLTDCERDILYRFLLVPRNSLQASPAIAGRAIVRLKIAKDAPVGEREFRLIGRDGKLSNPLKFMIGNVPEFREDFFPYPPAKKTVPEITIPAAINGQITPGEIDHFQFKLAKGKTVSFKLLGRYFNAFIGDGVPGHFQAIMEVLDTKGKVLAYADDHYFDPDPALTFTAPADGTYVLQVRDALYRGREDFVYRINAFPGKLPLPESPAPKIAKLKVIDAGNLLLSDPVSYPVMIKHVLHKASGNNYKLKLKKGETVVLEVFARRLALPPDMRLIVKDSSGKILAHNDDAQRLKAGLILHNSADPVITFTAPASDTYTVNAADTAAHYGAAYKYYLRIDKERPRFAVYSVPSALHLTADSANPITLVAERFDNFKGKIKLKIKSPAHYRFAGSDTIPADCERTTLTITGKYDNKRPVQPVVIEASHGDFTTCVIPGDEATQAFAYTHINPAQNFLTRVVRRGIGFNWQQKKPQIVLNNKPVTLTANLTAGGLPVNVEVSLQPVDLPEWIKLVPNKKSRQKTKLIKLKKKRTRLELPPLQITLQAAGKSVGKEANVLFKATWTVVSKPDKNGKVRRYHNEVLLPALHIKGGKI